VIKEDPEGGGEANHNSQQVLKTKESNRKNNEIT